MHKIFLNKDESILKYESIKLVNERIHKNRQWTSEQTQILADIIKENQNSNKWNDIARKLFQKSNHQFFRSGKQCRQRWLNHLDPWKKKGEWDDGEDKLIISSIFNYGRRWSYIAKELGKQRTEHMVKNRYKTLIIKQKKITPKISNQNSLLKQIAKRLIGENYITTKQQLPPVKQENQQQEDSFEQSQQIKREFTNNNNNNMEINQMIISQAQNFQQVKCEREQPFFQAQQHENQQKNNKKFRYEEKQCHMYRDPILSQVIEEYAKVLNTSNTPINYQLQQIYSPFYVSYQAITPYLSPSPTIPFFMNNTFSSFDNAFTNNLFIRNNNMQEKKEDRQ